MKVDVALVHHPVVNRIGETIGSAVTNLDLHDIARAGRTYGVNTYWVVTPFKEQQELAAQIVGHWQNGHGATVNPDRQNALSIIRIRASIKEAIAEATTNYGERPCVLATCAKRQSNTRSFAAIRAMIGAEKPVMLLFGTAWGLSPDVMEMVDGVLPPLQGPTPFNHLSVRSAASIMLDRLLGRPDDWEEEQN